ncbi:mitochondrial co-chaperone GrpE, putative [Paecilomyces variotii No. 5]|uniref:GrpE protein homolog n=1 Tax=Byssochlamys spectabilis (strain No. 5 / NBRC 109023) TaxID=1356009 RepID=V5FXT9_BYSSN|nr:mitochondrial co-chaperone GrpE, putative [Paecilomyces variotii No. 5]
MFQRTLLRQSQAVRSALSSRPLTTAVSSPLTRTSPLRAQFPSIRAFPLRSVQRLYSSEAESTKSQNAENKSGEESKTETEGKEEDPVKKELEAKQKEVIELKDKYLRSVADFRNLQERTKRDIDNARTFAIQRFANDLLDTVDNFDRALSAVPADKLEARGDESLKDLHNLYDGLKMTEHILMNTLKKHGLERFDPGEPTEDGKPQKFDPNRHEATFMAKAEGKEDGEIMYTQSKGFILNGRVVRAAKVGVVKNS